MPNDPQGAKFEQKLILTLSAAADGRRPPDSAGFGVRREGQVTELGPNRWKVRWFVGRNAEGKRQYGSKVVHGSRRDAERFLRTKLVKKDEGQLIRESRATFSVYWEQWLEQGTGGISPRTQTLYRRTVAKHVLPTVGAVRLDKVTPYAIQTLLNRLSEKGLAPSSVRKVYNALRKAFGQAVKWRLLMRTPCEGIELPKNRFKRSRAYSREELQRFRAAGQNSKFGLLWEFLAVTGCRPGEALALEWSHLRDAEVQIQQALTHDADEKWVVSQTKTEGSRRTIPLPAPLWDALQIYKKERRALQLKNAAYWDRRWDLVFGNEIGGPLDLNNLRPRHYKPLAVKAGIEGAEGPYDLRHTCVTLLLAGGMNPKVVAEPLGHNSVQTLMDPYAHVLPSIQEAATDEMAEVFYSGC